MANEKFVFPNMNPLGGFPQYRAAMQANMRYLEHYLNTFLQLTSGAVGAHSDLTGVGADDHHAEAHTVASHSDTTATGAELEELTDGSTTALHSHAAGSHAHAHADLSGVGTDDHHAQSHAHNGVDGSGTVAHSALTGVGASDHHVKYTDAEVDARIALAVINDLSDVVISGTPADNEVLAYDTGTAKIINQTAAEAGLATSGHAHTGTYLPLAGGTMSGDITMVTNSINFTTGKLLGNYGSGIAFTDSGASTDVEIRDSGGTPRLTMDDTDGRLKLGADLFYDATGAPLVKAAIGSAAAPAFTFAYDEDTGMYRNAANSLSFSAGNSTRLRLSASKVEIFDNDLQTDFGGNTSRSLAGNVGSRVYRSSDQSGIATSTWTFINFNAEEYDDDTWHNNVTNPERITVEDAGWYMVSATARFLQSGWSTGPDMRLAVVKNSQTTASGGINSIHQIAQDSRPKVSAEWVHLSVAGLAYLDAGEWVTCSVWHDTGSNESLQANITTFSVAKAF